MSDTMPNLAVPTRPLGASAVQRGPIPWHSFRADRCETYKEQDTAWILSPSGGFRKPASILKADNGTLELANSGDPAVAEEALTRLTEQFGAVVRDRLFQVFGKLGIARTP